jgi:hypothetical protein
MKIIKLNFLIILTSIFFVYGEAQEVPTKSADLPLKLTIKVEEKELCIGREFKIVARMENVSDTVQIIDERDLWRYSTYQGPPEPVGEITGKTELSFTKLLKIDRFLVAFGDSFPDEEVPKKYLITLKPKEFYEYSQTIKKDDHFFRIPGKYFILTGYGQYADWSAKGVSLFIGYIESNKLELTLSGCKTN